MPIDPRFGRVSVEKEPGNPLGEDEPVFIFRARDGYAPVAIAEYRDKLLYRGVAHADSNIINRLDDAIRIITDWQKQNPSLVKNPD